MKPVASPQTLAALLVLLMLGPIVPTAAATHSQSLVPDLPALPHARPSDQCVPMGVNEDILARVNQLAAGDPSFFLTDKQVPAVCVSGGPVQEIQALIREADRQFDILRNVSREIQRQADQRVEATLPESDYPEDLIKPTTVLLSDEFDGRRVGGFGDWTVVTQKGEPEAFRQDSRQTFNGTVHSWRFGDDDGYERGVHQWLVSPEIDLTALNGNRTAVNDLALARQTAVTALYHACNVQSLDANSPALLGPTCGRGTALDSLIVRSYEEAYAAYVESLPVAKHGAYLELTYTLNMALAQDGVRVWIYAGPRAPDRLALFSRDFGVNATISSCPSDTADELMPAPPVPGTDLRPGGFVPPTGNDLTCSPVHYGAEVITSLPGTRGTKTFQDSRAPRRDLDDALTGDLPQVVTARVNLTSYMQDRVWILFEVKTDAATRASAFFEDKAQFPRQEAYGFELRRVHAEGDAYLRNFRVKDVGAEFPLARAGNAFRDDPLTVRTAAPATVAPVEVRVHNAGDFTENGTLTVTFEERFGAGDFIPFNTTRAAVNEMRPDEVRTLTFLWPKALAEDRLYRVRADLAVDERVAPATGEQTRGIPDDPRPQAADPNATTVRPANAPSARLGGNLTANLTLRADTVHALVPAHVGGGAGAAFEVCRSPIEDDVCVPENAAEKGRPRALLLGVRNDGNAPEDATIQMKVELDGVDVSGALVDGPTRELRGLLPGETRPVTWTLSPTEPGTYRVRVALQLPDGSTSGTLIERNVYVQRSPGIVCFDDLAATRECSAAFVGALEPALNGENATAAVVAGDGTLYVATNVSQERGLLAARAPDGEWTVLANLSSAVLNQTLAPPRDETAFATIREMVLAPNGTLYLVGANGTVLARSPEGALRSVPTNATANLTNFTSATWFQGTLWAVGTEGGVFHLKDGLMEEVNLSYVHNASRGTKQYEGTLHAVLAAPNGRLYVAGELGYLASYDGKAWSELKQDGETTGTRPASWLSTNRTLTALAWKDGRLFAAGNQTLLVTSTAAGTAMRNVTQPPALRGALRYTDMFVTHLGGLYLATDGGEFVTCATCLAREDPNWTYSALALPSVFSDDASRPARIAAAAAGSASTYLVGQAGAVLELVAAGTADNFGDWSTVPPLAARDGGVIQVAYNRTGAARVDGAYRGEPTGDGLTAARGAEKFRIRMDHHVARAAPSGQAFLRLFFQQFPSGTTQTGQVGLCDRPDESISTTKVCHVPGIMAEVQAFDRPSDSDTWVRYESGDILPPAGGATLLGAVEFFAETGSLWAIDDIVLEGYVGGKWVTIVAWYGINHPDNRGAWANYIPNGALGSLYQAPEWEESLEAFDMETVSAWHISTALADRPVWVANDEIWPNASGGARPRLRSDWNTRLLTPAIDLSNAYDPVISFRHAYAFRTQIDLDLNGNPKVASGDGGYLEVQYLRRGADCGAASETVTCGWSPFYRIHPDGGYPNATDLGFAGYGFKEDLSQRPPGNANSIPVRNWTIGYNKTDRVNGSGLSYWGRSMTPDPDGVITGPRYTEDYVEARFSLNDQVCTLRSTGACLTDVDFRGRVIRVAFHLETTGALSKVSSGVPEEDTVFNHSKASETIRASYPGEGWYITDFKVLGARDLGIDLRAANMTVNVGYDVDRIGVGPGTRVPINITVENRGIFDAAGYTGELEVRRVDDAVRGITTLVERIPLSQQPLLPSKRSVNHTLFWSVPPVAEEDDMANYTLTFTLTPLGIDRDEDPLDNVARIGSLARPLAAKIVREFHTELAVSPENATTDITRYVPIFLNNTGNVPLSGFTVRRDVTVLQGPLSRVVEQRTWTTDRPAPPGARTPLATLSDGLNPTADLFWKAPERANYLFSVTAATKLPDGSSLASSADRRVSAFATYLFDDVEGGPRGETTKGEWQFGPGWSPSDPGFRSPSSYAFGDTDLGRYPADSDSAATTPLVDVSGARSARLAFYHRYDFEEAFDGGVVEASNDGGKTWTPLAPARDALNELPLGYIAAMPLSPASPLHTTGNPDDVQHAFSGDSRTLPAAVDGWVLSEFDLTDYSGVSEADVAYERYGSEEIAGYVVASVLEADKGPNVYLDKTWLVGSEDAYRYWEVQNLTQATVRSVAGNESFWWSGSITRGDDNKTPTANMILAFEADLTNVAPDQTVTADWWEWAEHFNQGGQRTVGGSRATVPNRTTMLDAYVWWSGVNGPHTVRFNLSAPEIVETDGKWLHLRADLTPYLNEPAILTAEGRKVLNVKLGYTPFLDKPDPKDRIPSQYLDDRGYAIDGFTISAERRANGQLLSKEVLLGEEDAWKSAQVFDCGLNVNDWMTNPGTFACFNSTDAPNPLTPLPKGNEGVTWSLQTELRPIASAWGVVPVRDHANHTATNPLPTGAEPKAWWTGDTSLANCVPGVPCASPGSESRLVTPAFDLGRVAGDSAELTFWHRYAFQNLKGGSYYDPIGSGGVVEIQVLDSQTNTWSDWQQIYSDPAHMGVGPRKHDLVAKALEGEFRGGYSAYTVNATLTGEALLRRNDAPFAPVFEPTLGRDVMYMYSGKSTDVDTADGRNDGWVQERFDVSEYIGKKVRFGFHAYFSGESRAAHNLALLPDPDGDGAKGGWWVSDVSLVGKVLAGHPIQLRLRAATDGNVHEGSWEFDDFGLFGARYGRNVALFVDETPEKYGVVAGETVTVPITIRNLGDSVRRDLAIEVRNGNRTVGLNFTGEAPKGAYYGDGIFRLQGFNLAPGQSTTVNLVVRAPAEAGSGATTLLFQLQEGNPQNPTDPYQRILDNEVQGFLRRSLGFQVRAAGEIEFPALRTLPAQPKLGEPVDLVVTARNPGYMTVGIELTCRAESVEVYRAVDHRAIKGETPIVRETVPCERVSGATTVGPRGWENITFRATPRVAGTVRFTIGGHVVDGIANANITPVQASAFVGESGVRLTTGFDLRSNVVQNWSAASDYYGATSPRWSYLRGDRAPGSILLGADENMTASGKFNYASACPSSVPGGGGVCAAMSPPVDLHNFTQASEVFLTFSHLDRFARGDGGQVKAQVLLNEARPGMPSAWSEPCLLRPAGGYEGAIKQFTPDPNDQRPADPNPGFEANRYMYANRSSPGIELWSGPDFFVSDRGFEERWTTAVVPLSQVCDPLDDRENENLTLIGHTVRFLFYAYLGAPTSTLARGYGEGWFIDDVSVGPYSLELRPQVAQRANLLDNTTKGFNVVLRNNGSYSDLVSLAYDAGNSSAPADSIRLPSEPIALAPGETRIVRIDVTLPRDPSLLPTEYKVRVTATSLIDPHASAPVLLDLFFLPRQWAELSVTVDTPKDGVQEGTEKFLPIVIENNGLVDSIPSRVRIVDTWAGGEQEYSLDLPSMPSYFQRPEDATRTLEFLWRPAKGSIGPHTLTVTVDPDAVGEEYTRVDNVVSLVVPVTELLLPDVAIEDAGALTLRNAVGGLVPASRDADVTRYEVTAGEVVSLELKVVNRGRAAATNVDVRAFIGELSLPPKNVPFIAPGSEVVLTFNWLAQKGEHELFFRALTEGIQLSTDNDRNPGVGVTQLIVKGYEVSVELDAVPGILEPGTDVKVPFKVVNTGNAGEELRLRASAPNGLSLLLPRETFYLRAGETYEGVATLHLPAEAVAGEQFISIEAVSRENPMKVAAARAPANVRAFYGGSVVATLADGAPPTLTLPVTLRNEGNSLEPWNVSVRLPAGWVAREVLPAKVVVPANGQATLDLHVTVPETTAPGERTIAVRATMPNGERRDGTISVNVLPLRAASVTITQEIPKPAQGALAYPVVVENTGNVKAPFEMVLLDVPSGVEVELVQSRFDLPPGGKVLTTMLVTPNATLEAGAYAVTGYTLFPGVNPDTAEGRANLQPLRVSIVRQDLRLGSLEYAPRADLDAGDRVTVKAPVFNRGQVALTNVPVHLYVDDVFIAETVIASLAPGQKVDATLNWTAVVGTHTLTIVLDPYKDTVDADREDNAVSALATVGTESPTGGLAAGRAKVPGFGATLALVAIACALLASMGSRRQRR